MQSGRSRGRDAQRLAERATRLHRDGDAAGAEALFREALSLDPALPDALHGMGLLALDRGMPAQAIALIGRALRGRPHSALFTLNLGLALLRQGHVEEARAALLVSCLRDPGDPRAHSALAGVLERLGRFADARASAETALARARDTVPPPGLHALLGRLASRDDDWARAAAHLSDAVAERPDDAGAWHGLAVARTATGQAGPAEHALRQVASLLPDDPAAHANLGAHLFERNRMQDARASLQRAVALGSPRAETLSNLGLVLLALGELEPGEAALAEAARSAPHHAGIAVNHGTALLELDRIADAERRFAAVEAEAPGSADAVRARFNRATLLLGTGRFEAGWHGFEARRTLLGRAAGPSDWDGSPLSPGQTLLIEAEQGLGDAIQFLRYLPLAMGRAPSLVLALPAPLLRLAQRSLPAGCRVVQQGAPIPHCAARADLLSLPLLLGRHEPYWTGAYLHAEPVAPGGRIGLCWAGSPDYRFDRRRSLRLRQLAPLAAPGRRFVALQRGRDAEPAPHGMPIERPALPDLADTADLIAALDLVISVDTAVAHLAGALGRPVWLLTRFGGDWRWRSGNLSADGRSRWYPSLRPFRVRSPAPPEQAWPDTIAELADALDRR